MNHPDKVWLFDIDGTLIGSIRSDQLRPGAVELLRILQSSSTTIVAWSAGGADYAKRMLAQCEIDHFFSAFYAKEERDEQGRYLVGHLAPQHQPGTLVDDYPKDVPTGGRVIGVRQFLGGNPVDSGLTSAIDIAKRAIPAPA